MQKKDSVDLESGPLLKGDGKPVAPQEVPGRILGLPTQLVAGVFYCSGEAALWPRVRPLLLDQTLRSCLKQVLPLCQNLLYTGTKQ